MNATELKREAAAAALSEVRSGMALGLGTGSTVAFFLDLLGERIRSGDLTGIVGVPTSVRTEEQARALGIELVDLDGGGQLDLTIDGADEVSPELDLIKGLGGALLREKMVAQASRRLLIIADDTKVVERLGTRAPLPVEVVAWGLGAQERFLAGLGAEPALREGDDGTPVRSDNGNLFLDCRFPGGIDDPTALEARLRARSGVVESGLFIGMADEALIASDAGVRVLRRGG